MNDWQQVQREKALKFLEDYRLGKVSESHYSSMIIQWGKAQLLEARPDIEPFLYSSDAFIRGNALHVLAGPFHLQDYWPTAVQFLLYDPDYIARTEGATALAWLKTNTRDQRTLAILASVVSDYYDDDMIRKDTYRAIRIVAYGNWEPLGNPPENSFNLERDADWDFIHASVDVTWEKERKEEAVTLLELYRVNKVPTQDYYTMLLKFGHAKLQEARSVVEQFLSSPTLLLRKIAFRVLVLYLQVPGNWQLAVDALQHDPDDTYRQEAAPTLGLLMRGTRDKATLRILAPFIFEDNDISMDAFLASEKIYAQNSERIDYKEIEAFLASPDDTTGSKNIPS